MLSASTARKQWRRNPNKRVFVNRSVAMAGLKAIGFDMDYTLAVYKSPQYEELGFGLLVERLLAIGYPEEIKTYQYDPSFVTRGLVFDSEYGNILKVDGHGNILVAAHGLRMLRPQEIRKTYPNKFIQKDEGAKYYIYNTLFNLPEIYLMACVVDMFEKTEGAVVSKKGIMLEDEIILTYKQLQKDVRSSCDWVHMKGELKNKTIANPAKYVARDENLPILLQRMIDSGKKLFLVTNSEYYYTSAIMTYLFDVPTATKPWIDYFHVSIVDSRKPLFFEEGTLLRVIDPKTGNTKLGKHIGGIKGSEVYSGGSYHDVTEILECHGKEIMYIGDHIFGDILRSKKALGWRTFLVIPELADEIHVWGQKKDNIQQLAQLDDAIGEMFSQLDSASAQKPDITQLQNMIRHVVHDMDMAYGKFGSLFRTGSRNTMFAGQVLRFADLYASSFINLLHYPFSFLFRAEAQLLPHETSIQTTEQSTTMEKSIHQDTNQQDTLLPNTNPEEDEQLSAMTIRQDANKSDWHVRRTSHGLGLMTIEDNKQKLEETDCNSAAGSRPQTPVYITHDFDDDDEPNDENTEEDSVKTMVDKKIEKRTRNRLDTDNN